MTATLNAHGTYMPATVPDDYAATRAGILWTAANLAASTRLRYGHCILLDVDLLAWTLDTLIEDHPRRSRTLVKAGPAVGAAARRAAAATSPLLRPEQHGSPRQWMSWQQAIITQERDHHRHPGPQLWHILATAATLAGEPGDRAQGLIPGRWPDIDRHRPNRPR